MPLVILLVIQRVILSVNCVMEFVKELATLVNLVMEFVKVV